MVHDNTSPSNTERAEGERCLIYPSPSLLYYMTAPPQHKQRYYYIFWTVATLAVVCGQIYVASSYSALAEALKQTLL